MADLSTSIVIGWIDNGNTRGEFAHTVALAAAYEAVCGRFKSIIRFRHGPQMPEGRNMLVEAFLETDAEWLMMIDSDMVFAHNSIEKLIESADPKDAPVVSGLCFAINTKFGQYPVAYRNLDGVPVVVFKLPDFGMMPVDAIGAAFMLTHRTVFENYRRPGPHPWFHRLEVNTSGTFEGAFLGEDLSWCWWLRTKDVPIYVNVDVEIGHIKSTSIGRNTYRHESEKTE